LGSRSKNFRKSSGTPELPEVFTDRSLGAYDVPEGLRAAGFTVHTMVELYGDADAEKLEDPAWITEITTEFGLVLFSKDANIRRDHRDVVIECSARAFLLPDAEERATEQVGRYAGTKHKIAMRSRRSGPFIYMVRRGYLDHEKLD
jgi:PIN domain-containing protein